MRRPESDACHPLPCREAPANRHRAADRPRGARPGALVALVAGLIALIGLTGLAGCAAPYAPMGSSGGYEHQQLDERLFQVRFRGADAQRSRDLALLRAAEIGLALGYPQMVVRGSEYEEGVRSISAGATYASAHGRYGSAYSAPAYTTSRPGVAVVVEFYERPPEEPVLETYACADLAAALRAHYDLEPASP